MSSGSAPTSHGLTTVTICSAIAVGPGPGLDRKLLPSMPSSVMIRSTPSSCRPPGPNEALPAAARSCRTIVTSVIRTPAYATLARPGLAAGSAYDPEPPADPEPPLPGGSGGMPTQLGAGGEARVPTPNEVCAIVPTPITRMSPAGMPCAFTVTLPSRETDIPVVTRWPRPDTAGGVTLLVQPRSIGTTTTCLSPSLWSLALAPAIPDGGYTASVIVPSGFFVTAQAAGVPLPATRARVPLWATRTPATAT